MYILTAITWYEYKTFDNVNTKRSSTKNGWSANWAQFKWHTFIFSAPHPSQKKSFFITSHILKHLDAHLSSLLDGVRSVTAQLAQIAAGGRPPRKTKCDGLDLWPRGPPVEAAAAARSWARAPRCNIKAGAGERERSLDSQSCSSDGHRRRAAYSSLYTHSEWEKITCPREAFVSLSREERPRGDLMVRLRTWLFCFFTLVPTFSSLICAGKISRTTWSGSAGFRGHPS
jgi:hypothetical protein